MVYWLHPPKNIEKDPIEKKRYTCEDEVQLLLDLRFYLVFYSP